MVWGEFDFRTIDCQEGEMNLTRGRVNLSGKDSGGLNTKPKKVIKLENNELRPQ